MRERLTAVPPALKDFEDRLLPLRAQADLRNAWLRQRLDDVLPQIMARTPIDLWLVIAREYNEDPVIMTMLPEPSMAARRRTILAFMRHLDGSVRRVTIDRYGFGDFYEKLWDPAREPQFECLARLVREFDPQHIGINVADDFAFGDGLSHGEYQQLTAALGAEYSARMTSAEALCVGWLEARIAPELVAYPAIAELGHALIAEAYSTRVIHPGITTTDDVVWWFRQKMHDFGLCAWFQPSVEIQAPGQAHAFLDATPKRKLILPGDLLHCDVGFYYLGLATDHQQHAYVLQRGEGDAPDGLKAALADGNRLQDIHMDALRVGSTGNAILAEVLAQARAEGIRPMVYSHPIGYHGHAAGPVIGLWDGQDGVPGKGDYPVYDNTAYSIELNITRNVPEWGGQDVRIMLEEDAALVGGRMDWLNGRQTAFHLIG
jgi:hypothetical protein